MNSMKIKNISNRKLIASDIEEARTSFQKSKGLMWRKNLPDDYGMLFDFGKDRKEGFWMLFMKIPIDMIFINSGKEIVDIKHSIKHMSLNPLTWRIYYPKKPARWVLEMKAGSMKRLKTKIGDNLEF